METPTPARIEGSRNSEYVSPESAITAIHPIATACSDSPATMNGRSPTRSTRLPTSGATVMNVTVQGINRRPASSGP